ncbi:MAG: hypothetical protein OEY70_03440 [Acidimicrobiia bacterium]|nr:hypothetical protein [Acidimicrobiia bacterium]
MFTPQGSAPLARPIARPAGLSRSGALQPDARATALTPTGGSLGRGLSGILDQAAVPARAGAGLRHLLGPVPSVTPPRVRQFVVDTALAVIAEGFEADAVVFVRREEPDRPPVVSTRIPPSWDEASEFTFELFGQLWRLLQAPGAPEIPEVAPTGPGCPEGTDPTAGTSIRVGPHHGWISRRRSDAGDLVAAVVRTRPFSPAEQATLNRVVRSVTVAVGDRPLAIRRRLSASVTAEGDGWRAEVAVAAAGRAAPGCAGYATGPRPELAAARAAAHLGRPPYSVAFAGCTRLDQAVVTIVVVNAPDGSPLLGLAVSDDDGPLGPAEAVLSAMAAVGDWPARA